MFCDFVVRVDEVYYINDMFELMLCYECVLYCSDNVVKFWNELGQLWENIIKRRQF